MIYKFTKFDEGKYFCRTILSNGDYFHFYYYIIRVTNNAVACRYFAYVPEMVKYDARSERDMINHPNTTLWKRTDHETRMNIKERRKWQFKVINVKCDIPDLVQQNPLDLILLDFFKYPSKYLTKKQRQILEIKDEIKE